MKKKRFIILLLQICLIIGFAFSFYQYTQKEIQPTDVYIFKQDVPANTKLTEDIYEKVQVPASIVKDNFITNPDDLKDKYTATKIFANEYVTDKLAIQKSKTDPFESMDLSKYRKVTLPLSYAEGFAGNIKKGDSVDLVYTGTGAKEEGAGGKSSAFQYSRVFLQNVLVYNVATEDGYKFTDHSTVGKGEVAGSSQTDKQEIDTSGNTGEMAMVTLAVTLDQAEEIQTRLKSGQVKFLGRFEESKSYDSLGYVLGDFSKLFSGNDNAETSKTVVNGN